MSYERRLDGLERRVSELDGGVECRACGYPVTDGSRAIQVVHRIIGVPDNFPPIRTCTDCGNQVNVRGQYVAHYKRIILEKRVEDDAPG